MNGNPTRILLVEDNPGDARLIQEMIAEAEGSSFEIDWVPQLSAGLEKLGRGEIDVVLLDLGLPDSRGLDTFVKAYSRAPQIPFVVLTGLNDETVALTAVRKGAQDYLVKGQTDGGLLLRAIRYATERKRIEEELRLANEELRREIEERRAAELAVEAERQRLFALMEGLPAMVSLIAPDFSLVFGNRVFGELFGNWQGKHCYEVIFGKEEPCKGCPAVEVMANQALTVKEMTIPVNGRVFNIYKYPFTDVDGTSLVLSLGIDITERKRAEEALEAERQRLYSLLDGLPGLVYLKAPDFSLKFANRLFREICGDWKGKTCYEAIFNRESPCEHCTQFQVLRTGKPSVKEASYGESNRIFQVYSYPFADVDGASLVLTLGIDITERKQAEDALGRQKAEQQVILDSVPAMIFYKDIHNRFVRVNRAMAEITGVSTSGLEGKTAVEVFPDFAVNYFRDDQEVIASGSPKRNIIEPVNTATGLRWVQTDKIPYRDDSGNIIGVIGFSLDITERKQAEEMVERLASFPELNPHPVFEVNGEGALTYYNAATTKALVELGVEGDGKLFLPEDYEIILQAIRGTESKKFYREVQINDVVFEEYIDVIPRFDVARFRAYNITARKKAEEKLRQSQARLAKAQRLAHLGNWEWDLQSGEVIWSEEVYRIFGVDPHKFTPSLVLMMKSVHPEDEARVRKALDKALAGVKPCNLINRLIRPDGSVRYIHSQAEVIFEENGQPQRLLGTAQDITERRTAEMRLQDSEARFRAIFESAAMGISLTKMNGAFLTANKAMQEMLGYREEELRGKTWSELTHAEDRNKNMELYEELNSGQREHFQLEKRYRRKNGQYFWGRVTVSLVKDFQGKPLYTIGMVEDISQEKEAGEKLQESEEKLRYLASQLFTAQEDERKRISRELHDELGQALLLLKLQTGAIKEGLQPEQQQLRGECLEMLGNLDQAVDNIRRLSRDLSPMLLEDLGLSAALRHLIGEFGKRYQIKYSLQETDIDDLFPLPTQIAIYRIVQESLTNIGKHSQADLLLVAVTKRDDQVSILIQDNGKGFDSAQLRRQSSGMGLAAMEERARMLGGVLSIWSQEGAGTKISLDIPYSAKAK